MPLNRISNLLLYVPFTQEYEVPLEIHEKLTKEEFFRHCFVRPTFEDKIKEIKDLEQTEIDENAYPISKTEMINTLNDEINERDRFYEWLETDGAGIYCILGDAGTGKTTYLHFLQWEDRKSIWEIIDIQKANQTISLWSDKISFPKFSTLHGKAISSIIIDLLDLIFAKDDENNKYQVETCYQNLKRLLSEYRKSILPYNPHRNYQRLYDQLSAIKIWIPTQKSKQKYCEQCAHILADYFTKYCADACNTEEDTREALSCALIHLFIAFRCLREHKKTMIVIDNLERYIGVDEIYNDELIVFVSNLRSFSDQFRKRYEHQKYNINRFASHYQFIVSMRNTSVRNFTPQQNADFFEHSVDLSDWFSTSEIIRLKADWYHKNKIPIDKEDRTDQLLYILEDFGLTTSNTVRGLRPKLNLIFNYNKRLIVDYLMDVFKFADNESFIGASNDFRKVDINCGTSAQLARFAYRSIIWRLTLNKLREGGLFTNIFASNSSPESQNTEIEYVRKILTILSNYSLANGKSYMPFSELMESFFNKEERLVTWFYDENYALKRKLVARALYHMNYYNRRDNNWFQFLDIQYNVAAYNGKRLTSFDSLLSLIEDSQNAPDNINIRITNAGKAYLGYMIQIFEFVSCMNKQNNPLLSCIPTVADLATDDLSSLPCISIISETLHDAVEYVRLARTDKHNPSLYYKKRANDKGSIYATRLINSHTGYLMNFCECIDVFIDSKDKKIMENKQRLISMINSMRVQFRRNCTQIMSQRPIN